MGLLPRFRRRPPPLDPSFGQLLGDLQGPVARISAKGDIATLDRSWQLEWGVRAGTSWKRAAQETAVRQGRVDDAPVYETWMRVPGGDVIQRVGVINSGSGRALMVEYENASPNAVVVATVGSGVGPVSAELSGVRLDGVCWIRPSVDAGAVAVGKDIWAQLDDEPDDASVAGDGSVAVLVPLPHRQTISVTVTIDGDGKMRPVAPAEIAAGWRAVTADALSVEVPDTDLEAAWRRVVGDLVLAAAPLTPSWWAKQHGG